MLRHALVMCADFGMTSVMIVCHADNLASLSIIMKCGGVFVGENGKSPSNRYYRISLSKDR